MSAEYDAACEVREGLRGCEESLDCITVRLPTLRERAAIAAMQGLLACGSVEAIAKSGKSSKYTMETVVGSAVEFADALLAELAKKVSA